MISALILAKNETKNIKKCLKSINWCDEIIVIDDNSIDDTAKIAEEFGAKVYKKELKNFSDQRNYALKKVSHEWVLFIDADEIVSPALWYEIMETINNPSSQNQAYYLKRIDILWGNELKHGDAGKTKLLRLAKKSAGLWTGNVHEKWNISGKIGELSNPLYHYPHEKIVDFLTEINYYTDLRARELYKSNTRVSWYHIILYPKAKFIQNYIFKLGILDGMPGLVSAIIMSFHSFLVRGKLWLLWQSKK